MPWPIHEPAPLLAAQAPMIGIASDPCHQRQAASAPVQTACPDTARRWVVLTAILGSSMAFIDGTVVMVALPQMRADLDASLASMQWAVNAYTVTLAAFLLLGGAAGDALGRRRVFVAGVALFGLASLVCAIAPTVAVLITARAVQGIGGALLVPGSLALISAHFPKEHRAAAIGTWAAASGVAAALGPILGGWLVDLGSWPTIFLINLPVAAATVALALWRVPETVPVEGARMDWIGGALAVIGLTAIAWGLTVLGENWRSAGFGGLAALAGGVLLLALFLLHERRTGAPMMPPDLFASRIFSGANALTLLLYFALSGALLFLPTALIEAHGWSAARAGSVFLPFTLVLAVISRAAGGLADRVGARLPLAAGSLVTAAAMALLAPAVASGDLWTALVPVMLLLGLGMGIVVAPLSAAVMNAVPDDRSGIASGVNNAVSRIAGLIATASLGAVAVWGFDAHLASLTDPAAATLAAAGFAAPVELPTDLAARASLLDLKREATVAALAAVAHTCAAFAIVAAAVAVLTLGRPDAPARDVAPA